MPKYLFICRHADTSPALAGQSDFDRPLSAKGIADAQQSARWIHNTGLAVPNILCSAAVRTQSTARIFAQVLALPDAAVLPEQGLYQASARELEDRIGLLPASQTVALLVGHNPGVSRLVGKLNSQPDHYVPTAGVNLFTFATDDWMEIDWCYLKWQANY
jgi:phosphohistidine phosphatase